ncbi:AAA family ATPase [Thorsellia anophelis]|uniref:AAA domain-containing protein n=1 Tax=Thorsellia anophelis DSM 18579 TaxID=1123402 RepID=A0A1H9Y396_9GAMM|nr:AAA family ATPase [Thorsellia anophelis]SES63125.1 AAA domain-containing protein [Thorsellia anophelis DSM 18579]
MKRNLLDALIKWKDKPARKPLLINGARQTGKTYLLHQLLGKSFNHVLRIDFLENPIYKEVFNGALTPDEIIMNISLITNKPFNPLTDLLIFDEIGECERAVTSLKYFAESNQSFF